MSKTLKLIVDNQLVLKQELRDLKKIIESKALELNALRYSYSEKRKLYEKRDLRRAKVDGRFKVVEPKLDKIVKRKKGGDISKYSKAQISKLINELEKLKDEKEEE